MTSPDAVRFRGGAWLPGGDHSNDTVTIADGHLVIGGRAHVEEDGSLLPGVCDAHVHLTLIDPARFAGTPIDRVRDLGGDPDAVRLAAHRAAHVEVDLAGRFHTAIGGYPTGRSWAPDAAIRQLVDAADARRAVDAWASEHGTVLKVVLHAGMPLLDDAVLTALVDAAHAADMTVVAHVEGDGQTHRAITAGVDELAHTPWSEHVSDADVHAAADQGMSWVTTLSIHDGDALACAIDNLRRFVAAGGRVRYGTDLGNGALPIGVNATEIERMGDAGLHGDALITAVCGERRPLTRAWHSPHPMPHTARGLVTWLRDARPLVLADLSAITQEIEGAP